MMTEVTKEFIPKNEDEKIIEIEIERLCSFKNHPFQVKDDKEMHLLKESITELIPELLDMVDAKKLNFTIAVDISYIDKEMQKWIYEYIRDTGFIKPKQITALRKQLEEGPVNQGFMISIFNSCIVVKAPERKVVLSGKKLTKYFPEDYSETDMEKVIETLLEQWKREQK